MKKELEELDEGPEAKYMSTCKEELSRKQQIKNGPVGWGC